MSRIHVVPILDKVRESHHTTTYRFRADFGGEAGPCGGGPVLAVAGGTGVASLIAGIEGFAQQGARVTTALGAKTAEELLFADRAGASGEVHIATDDGARGVPGVVPALAGE